jgi:threonine aldolase
MLNKCFASDNCAGVHPDIMQALIEANTGYEVSYGDDKYTEKALKKFKEIFGEDTRTYFVYNGTGANTLALGSFLRPYSAVITPFTAHINIDETGAPERYTGCKIITVETPDGKLTPDSIKPYLYTMGEMHHSQIMAASITNPTETGELYKVEEIKALADFLHEHGILLHMDGARISNAAIALGSGFKGITKDCGVDVLSFGGTKNGMMFGEAVVFLNNELGKDFMYIRKNGTQLHSKMRYISSQFVTYLEDDLWKKNASHANNMAQILYKGLSEIDGVESLCETTCNSVFLSLPLKVKEKLSERYYFYDMDMGGGNMAARFMCSFNTTQKDIDEIIELAKSV